MKKYALFLTSALAFSSLLVVGGCKSGDAADSSSDSASSSNPASSSSEDKPKANTGPTKTVHSPAEAPEGGGGYIITPSNPNDPKFKQDPNLGGGG